MSLWRRAGSSCLFYYCVERVDSGLILKGTFPHTTPTDHIYHIYHTLAPKKPPKPPNGGKCGKCGPPKTQKAPFRPFSVTSSLRAKFELRPVISVFFFETKFQILAAHRACARAHGRGCAERAVPHGWTRAERISRPKAQAQDRTGPRQPGESPAAASCRPAARPAPAASGNSARQKRDRQPRGCAHAGCTHRHARLPVRAWLTPAC